LVKSAKLGDDTDLRRFWAGRIFSIFRFVQDGSDTEEHGAKYRNGR